MLDDETATYASNASQTSLAYARLRDDIVFGTLRPHEKLKIAELKARYQIGATPLREALSLLAANGLVDRVDQKGFRVARTSRAEFDEILELRCVLESRAVRAAIANGDRAWEDGIVLAMYRLTNTDNSRPDPNLEEIATWEAAHKALHMALISGCGLPTLLRICVQLYDQNNRYRAISRTGAVSRSAALQEHREIADACLARDADLAASRLVAHYRRTGQLLRGRIPE